MAFSSRGFQIEDEIIALDGFYQNNAHRMSDKIDIGYFNFIKTVDAVQQFVKKLEAVCGVMQTRSLMKKQFRADVFNNFIL